MITLITKNTGKPIYIDDDRVELAHKVWTETPYGYAVTNIKVGKVWKTHFLHAFILPKVEGLDTDHINGNKLDNRLDNLRHVTRSENNFNRGAHHNSKSSVRGVYQSIRWIVDIRLPDGKGRISRSFKDKEQAEAFAEKVYREARDDNN